MRISLRLRLLVCVALSLTFLHACSILESRLDPETAGVVYYLPRSLVEVEVKEVNNRLDFTFKDKPITDLRHRYVLNYQANPLFHDRLCVMVNNEGYLQSIEYAAEDATPRIAVALAELFQKLQGGGGDPLTRAFTEAAAPTFEPFSLLFDPFDEQQLRRVSAEITRRTKARYAIDFPDARVLGAARQSCDGKGVCFRAKITTIARILKNGQEIASQSVTVTSPQIGNLDLDRVFLVEKVTRLGFEDGALTDMIIKRPSQALAAVKIPLDVLDVILAVPTNFVGNLTGTPAAQKAYVSELQARTAAIESINANLNKISRRTINTDQAQVDAKVFKLSCQGKVFK